MYASQSPGYSVTMTDEKFNPLTIYHDELTRGLYPHIDCLVEKFSKLSLISKDELADLQAQEMQLKHLLDVVHDRKEKHNDSQCFDELIKFMKSSQDPHLSELADKMIISQDDDAVPCIQPVQSESSAVESCKLKIFCVKVMVSLANCLSYIHIPGFVFKNFENCLTYIF